MRAFTFTLVAMLVAAGSRLQSPVGASTHLVGVDQLPDLLSRGSAYVLQFEQQFSVGLSDEHYVQAVKSPRPRKRTLDSEMLYVWLAGDEAWLATRNVLKVDGKAVKGSQQRLDRLLDSGAPIDVAHLRRLRDESARFNIGTLHRNFNDPLFPLRFLEPDAQPRFSFSEAGDESLDHVATHKVRFEERTHPTIIQDRGADLLSSGLMWIADDGAVWRTQLDVESHGRGGPAFGSIVVQYRRDARVAMLVPIQMNETYAAGFEEIECEATYSNFRHFETSARIIQEEGGVR